MGDAYLNKKPIADDFEYVYAEFDGVIIRIPKEKVVAFAEAGGYYQPNVDEEGNLTWTASKEGMPAAETVNIKGPKGDDGADGKDGADGEPGKDGADGATPYIGDNGNWFIGDTDTGKPSRGEKGLDANVTVDAELSEKSTNPVQNAAVAKELSKLSNEIAYVKECISTNGTVYIPITWENGGINGGSGENVDNAYRIRSKSWENLRNIIDVDSINVSVSVGDIAIIYTRLDSSDTHQSGWVKNFTLPILDGYKYRFMYRLDDSTPSNLEWVENITLSYEGIVQIKSKDLDDKIKENKNSILEVIDTLSVKQTREYPITWENGGINGGSGENVDNAYRIRSDDWIVISDNLTEEKLDVVVDKGQLSIIYCKDNGSDSHFTGWITSNIELPIIKDYKYRFLYEYDGISTSDVRQAENVHLLYYEQEIFNSQNIVDELADINHELYRNKKSKDMKVVTFGDSMFLYGNRGDANSWQNVVRNYFSFKELISVGVGGTGYKWWTTSDRNFDIPNGHQVGDNLPFASGIENTAQHSGAFCSWYRIVNTIPSDTDLIIIGTGTNDFGASDIAEDLSDLEFVVGSNTDTEWANSEYYSRYGGDYKITTLRGSILSTIMKMQVIAPNAMIVFVNFPNTRLVDGTGKNGTSTHQPESQKPILDAIEYVHKWWGIPYIDVLGTCGINPLNRAKYTSDNIHCNTLGYSKMFANSVIAGLKPLLNNGI